MANLHSAIRALEKEIKRLEVELSKTQEATERRRYYNLEDDIASMYLAIRVINNFEELNDIHNSTG